MLVLGAKLFSFAKSCSSPRPFDQVLRQAQDRLHGRPEGGLCVHTGLKIESKSGYLRDGGLSILHQELGQDSGGATVDMVVDRLIGKREIVIESPAFFIGSVPGLSGCTVLGNGSVAIILDILGLTGACSQVQGQGIGE